ncbi:HK97 family phage prohead protease [Sphingobium lignivorans]|uniref:Prohead serine protease domain-containing protein n=1 Tax=Sphingobium lignivorans TaxID=2735886 RepID=A0ABR6NJG5_9SPHN|nr:HK97 family phage prohead protease [Sphingobium lignivorans]MBB5987423.1 hypothetical protein [Sphingobium lignivorans]
MQTKALTIKDMDKTGRGLAVIAQLSAIDSDDDTYAPGAFAWKEGGHQWASILPAHDRKHVSLGKVRVYEDGDFAMAEMMFNLDIAAAKDWHSAIMFDLEHGRPVQEYSYGYDALRHRKVQRGSKVVRELRQLDVQEVSPVLRGAGTGTRTLTMKNAGLKEERFIQLMQDLDDVGAFIHANPAALSATGLKQLADIHTALGKALTSPDATDDDNAADLALGDYMRITSRTHLRDRS